MNSETIRPGKGWSGKKVSETGYTTPVQKKGKKIFPKSSRDPILNAPDQRVLPKGRRRTSNISHLSNNMIPLTKEYVNDSNPVGKELESCQIPLCTLCRRGNRPRALRPRHKELKKGDEVWEKRGKSPK